MNKTEYLCMPFLFLYYIPLGLYIGLKLLGHMVALYLTL